MRYKTFLTFLILLESLKTCSSENAPSTTTQCKIIQFDYNYDKQNINFLWNTTGDNCENKKFSLVLRNFKQDCTKKKTNFIKNITMSEEKFRPSIHLDRCGFYEYLIKQSNVLDFKTKLIFYSSTDFKVTQKSDSSAEVSWKHSDSCCPKIYNLLVTRKFDNGIILNETVDGTSFMITNLSSCWSYSITLDLVQLKGDGQINQFEQTFKLQEKSNKDFSQDFSFYFLPEQSRLNIRIHPKKHEQISYLIKWKSENLLDINETITASASSSIRLMFPCMNYAVEIYIVNEKDQRRIFEKCVKSIEKGFISNNFYIFTEYS